MIISKAKGLVVAGTHSGSGKTTVTLGLLAALKKRGFSLAPFKIGPDFIDPGHHRQISGKQSRNLDGWMLSETENRKIFTNGLAGADIAVVEGVMGLFDGYDGRGEAGSTAQVAKWLGLDILLVVDARSMARSAAAVVFGFTRFDPGCRFAGVIFNNVASQRHLDYLRQAIDSVKGVQFLGGLPRNSGLVGIPDRHLGLVTAEDYGFTETRIDSLADFVETHLEVDRLIHNLSGVRVTGTQPENTLLPAGDRKDPSGRPFLNKVKIGVAQDNAFCFYYPENLELLEKFGAEIVFFSPVSDNIPPEAVDGLYLGGGYPELHAPALSSNTSMRRAILAMCKDGMPVYAECGGFMYLCDRLVAGNSEGYDMVKVFPFVSRMKDRRSALGYREICLSGDTPLGGRGLTARGHEFHYSFLENQESEKSVLNVYAASDREGKHRTCPGYMTGRCLGSYVHLHFGSCPRMAQNFAAECRRYQSERKEKENASF